MNPALIHSAYANSYPSQDRSFPNSPVVTNEYLDRRDGTINQSLTLGASRNVVDYNSSHSLQEKPYSSANSQYLLTPPQAAVEASAVSNQSSSTYPYSTLPQNTSSNVSNLDWTTATPSWPSTYQGMVTDMHHVRGPPMTHLSPPSLHSQFSYSRSAPMPMDPPTYRPSYYAGDAFTRPLMHRHMPIPISTAFPGPTFPPMSQNPPAEKEGPPFDETTAHYQIITSRGHVLKPDIIANIPKAFFQFDGKWTCYRRNYFSVSCAFTFKMHVLDSQIYLQRNNSTGHSELVSQWAISLSAKTAAANNCESEPRSLVQHTPKRDKASESTPTRHMVVPGPPPGLTASHSLPHNNFYPSTSHVIEPFGHTHSQSSPTSYTFERIQFQKATANNGKRRAQQQYFHLVVNLEANVGRPGGQEEWVIVATKQSAPIVVRGRSPGHYKDGRRDSQSSMDPDGHGGHGGDGGHSTYVMPNIGNNQVTNMTWSPNPNHMRQSTFYGSTYTQRADERAYSLSPETGTDSTPGSSNGHMSRTNASESPPHHVSIDRILLSPVLDRLNDESTECQRSKKRVYEDDGSDGARSMFPSFFDQTYGLP